MAAARSILTAAICPECNLHRGHRANCSLAHPVSKERDLSLEAYRRFLEDKVTVSNEWGFEIDPSEIHPWLLPHAKIAVQWAVRGGRRALFESFGLTKTVQQLEILRLVLKHSNGERALIVAPLGVRREFMRDAERIGIDLRFVSSDSEVCSPGIFMTNYEPVRDGKLNPGQFTAASLDEGNVLRGFGGTKTFREFMRLFDTVPFRFVATATPDPNEYIELLAYSAFLGVLSVSEAKTRFFKRDSTKADKLTIHPHKVKDYFLWLHSWALFVTKPSDLGCSDEGYDLPPYEIIYHELPVDHQTALPERDGQGRLYRESSTSVTSAAREKRDTLVQRIAKAKEIVDAEPDEHFILWHDLEDERRALEKAIPGLEAVYGGQRASQREAEKLEATLNDFAEGRLKHLGAKPAMFGSGSNFQYYCARAIFTGIGFKFNDWVQAIARIHRFQQQRQVRIHIIYAESEKRVLEVLMAKFERYREQLRQMGEIIRQYGLSRAALEKALSRSIGVERTEIRTDHAVMVNNDCVYETHAMEENSVHLIITSPPFSTMYEYSPRWEDFGATNNNEHFFEQMDFLTPQLLRVLKPGRIAAIHVKDRIVPGGVNGLGFQTVYPFHCDYIAHMVKHGFAFIGMKTIVTDVVRENNQTYRLGWTEQCKDGSKMGVGMPEYLLLFRKPPSDSTNAYADEPVAKEKPECVTEDGEIVPFNRNLPILPGNGYSRSRWQIDAHGFERSSGDRLIRPEDLHGLTHEQIFKLFRKYSLGTVYDYENHVRLGEELESRGILPVTFMLLQPQSWHPDVWTDITRMRTLNSSQHAKGRELHLCALQLDLVNRVINQMSMPGEIVLDPFGGLMTVPYCAVQLGRRAVGIELSESYFLDGLSYVRAAEEKLRTPTLFDLIAEGSE